MRISEPIDIAMFGCTLDQWKIVRGDPSIRYNKSPVHRWKMQRMNAGKRGIEWQLSLWDWWQCWQESGHWGERGSHAHEFVMCRHGDVGPYAIANVYIATARKNLQDARKSGKARARCIRPPACGVEILKRCKTRPYRAVYAHKRIGDFATFDEARAAYLAVRENAVS